MAIKIAKSDFIIIDVLKMYYKKYFRLYDYCVILSNSPAIKQKEPL